MRTLLDNCYTLLDDWKVKKIEVEEGGRIFVTAASNTETIRICEPHFGIGRKGRKTADLAKFVARNGLGKARRLYRFLSTMSRDFVGELPLTFPDRSSNSVSAIDDEDAVISASWDALDKAEEMDITKAERAALNHKIIASAVFGVDIDGVIGSLTRIPGQSRKSLLKPVRSEDVDALVLRGPKLRQPHLD